MVLTPGERYERPLDDDSEWPGGLILDHLSTPEGGGDLALYVETLDGYQAAGLLEEVGEGVIQVGKHRIIYEDIAAFQLLREPPLDRGSEQFG